MNLRRVSKSSLGIVVLVCFALCAHAAEPAKKSFEAPHGQTISVEMIGPVTQTTDLQIICVLKHDPAGDKYIEAMDDFNQKLGRFLSNLRERGEFAGGLGETLLFTPPANSITPRQVLLIGIGDEAGISIDRLEMVGAIAARESVRLKAANVSFAPALRDQGSSRIDVGDGDALRRTRQSVTTLRAAHRLQQLGARQPLQDLADGRGRDAECECNLAGAVQPGRPPRHMRHDHGAVVGELAQSQHWPPLEPNIGP